MFVLWECEPSRDHSLVPGGNGTEQLANQLQLSPADLKVSLSIGMIYSQVERDSVCECVSVCFLIFISLSPLFFSDWVAVFGGRWLRKEECEGEGRSVKLR